MCCFATALIFFGPRLGFLVYWLLAPVRVAAAFSNFNLPWLVGVVGLIFAPWTTLIYVIVYPLNGFDWIWIGLAIAADIASYMGAYRNRRQLPGYPDVDPLPPL